jgi:hypothetical protein
MQKWDESMVQGVECVPSQCKALKTNTSTTKKKERKEGRKEGERQQKEKEGGDVKGRKAGRQRTKKCNTNKNDVI